MKEENIKHFYFPFYADDFITGTLDMTCEEVGAYIRLLCYQFKCGRIPIAYADKLRMIAGSTIDLTNVITKFPDGINEKMKNVCESISKKSIESRKSALMRWHSERNANAMLSKVKSKVKVKYKYKDKNKEKEDIPAKAGTPQAEFVDNWSKLYESETGTPFKADRKDFILATKLLKDFSAAEVLNKAKLLFELCKTGGAWFAQGIGDFTIGKLSSHWNSILPQQSKTDRTLLEINRIAQKIAMEDKNAVK